MSASLAFWNCDSFISLKSTSAQAVGEISIIDEDQIEVDEELEPLPVKDQMEGGPEKFNNFNASHKENSIFGFTIGNSRDISIAFSDIVRNIRPFSGNTNYPIELWIKEFEDFAKIIKLNDEQKVFFAKNALKGPAKIFSDLLYDVREWEKLKEHLLKEFLVKEIPVDVHKKLMNRKQKFNETLDDYVLVMRFIGSRANIDEESIIAYIIDGIDDISVNKVILYGAKTFAQFNEKLQFYKKITQRKTETFLPSVYSGEDSGLDSAINCSDSTSDDSRYEKRSTPVLKNVECSQSNACSRSNKFSPSKAPMKTVLINNFSVNALFDTGSVINIMKESLHVLIGSPKISPNYERYVGVGGGWIMPIGFVWANLTIDNEKFFCKFYLVPDNLVIENVILGQEILSENEVTLTNGFLTIKKSYNIHLDDSTNQRSTGVAMINTFNKADKAKMNFRNLTIGSPVPVSSVEEISTSEFLFPVSKRRRDSQLMTPRKKNSINKRNNEVAVDRKKTNLILQQVYDTLSTGGIDSLGMNHAALSIKRKKIPKCIKGTKNINLSRKYHKVKKMKMLESKKIHPFTKTDKVDQKSENSIIPTFSPLPFHSSEEPSTSFSQLQRDSPEKKLNKIYNSCDKVAVNRKKLNQVLKKSTTGTKKTQEKFKNRLRKNIELQRKNELEYTITHVYNLRKTKRVNYKGQC